MDLYLNLHSTDLGDSNNESTFTACKVLGHMLSECRSHIDDLYLSVLWRYSPEIGHAHTKPCWTRARPGQWYYRVDHPSVEQYPRFNSFTRYSSLADEHDRSIVRITRGKLLSISISLWSCRELYVKEIVKLETIDSLLQILLYKDLETKQ